jgi:hypothetical protein
LVPALLLPAAGANRPRLSFHREEMGAQEAMGV